MNLYLSFCVGFFLLGTALSGPLDVYLDRTYHPTSQQVNAQGFGDFAHVQGYPAGNLYKPIEQNVPNNMQETKENAGPDYINEIKDQVKQSNNNEEEAEVQGYKLFRSVKQGSTVAFQPLYDKRSWLGCPGSTCGKKTCPGLYMEGADWYKCWGEVFRIYRASGPGTVKVGDLVGLYYPRQSGRWFSTTGGRGRKSACPGSPTTAHGFASSEKWYHCWGEVFKIYSRGKSLGAEIEEHDDIMLHYLRDKKWVGLVGNTADLRTCPGSTRPPEPSRYQLCWGENFELWLL